YPGCVFCYLFGAKPKSKSGGLVGMLVPKRLVGRVEHGAEGVGQGAGFEPRHCDLPEPSE
ncbi:hypothetical protein, partial [Marinilabilia sp.]